MNNINIISNDKCNGCASCFNACPFDAINMIENEEGFLYPQIDEKKCKNCGICLKKCSTYYKNESNLENPECYALMAIDEIRKYSSSGGAFTLLAEKILEKKGYICGASYNENFSVNHIIVDNSNDLNKLKGSKYFQSTIGSCYKEIKEILENDNYVLFSGTPCQVAGLNSFLEKEYEKLITVELLCHGTPSYKIFKKYLEENFDINEIEEVNFRNKELSWRCDKLTIKTKNQEIQIKKKSESWFEEGFHSSLFNRKSCAPCQYAKLPRVADITIADWWGIDKIDKNLDDKKGTSLILINNEKAKKIYKELNFNIKKNEKIDLELAKKSVNRTIYAPLEHHKNRNKFFEDIKKFEGKKVVKMCKENKFDIGILGLWMGNNYGCVATGYALYKLCEELGYTTAFIDKKRKKKHYNPNSMINRFVKDLNVFLCEEKKTNELNNNFDNFIVGSDQVWNYNLTSLSNRFMFLDFAQSNKRKIAYSSSLGNEFTTNNDNHENEILAYLLNKFDAISVRENYAVDELKNKVNIDAIQVLDPVFVCDKKAYLDLIQKSNINVETDYMFAYVLDPTPEKNEILKYISSTLNLKLIVCTDATHNEKKKLLITQGEVLGEIDFKDWLKYYLSAKYIFTDSFHGTCFSIIFEKNFVSMGNIGRGIKRFNSLLENFEQEERLILSLEEIKNKKLLEIPVNYEKNKEKIQEQKDFAKNWLKNALENEVSKHISDYDITKELIGLYSKPELYYRGNYLLNKILYNLTLGQRKKEHKEKSIYWKDKIKKYKKSKGFLINY